jgi:hypothetical protein
MAISWLSFLLATTGPRLPLPPAGALGYMAYPVLFFVTTSVLQTCRETYPFPPTY